ncbi:aspartyl/asparaginyl beta-hydroxylase domain-containing protein [Sphingopyxis sp.]|uniref:aspartyl/asparaginyl beta-hydroxylase domain-containing protein n=1 Tax=Sphingopyxis sp. TaxID=1908224 RepID=UPI002ED91339
MSNPDVANLLGAAAQARRGGDSARAADNLRAALSQAPNDPVVLNSFGMMRLDEGKFSEACGFFEQAIAADASAPDLWMNLATAQRLAGDDIREAVSLDQALAIDQRHFMANVRRAELHEKRGETAGAMHRWSGVIALAEASGQANASLDQLLTHARRYIADVATGFEKSLSPRLAKFRDSEADSLARRRFEACVGGVLGRRRVYANECHGLHYPFLPADEFFDRDHFPWLERLEAQTDIIREELLALLASGGEGLVPYVRQEAGTSPNKWSALDNSPAWSACFLWKHGVRQDDACAQCPQTAALLQTLPMSDIPGRSPSVFFSLLRPGAHIPPHTGVTNVRSIVHLPLIVPPGCGFRVGGETRAWEEGRAFVFDDTIEHEAWNTSDALRAVLIFDVWNPHLQESERDMLRGMFQEMIDYGLDSGHDVDD